MTRRRVLASIGLVGTLAFALLAFRGFVRLHMESHHCDLTPPGHEDQFVVSKQMRPLWYDCVMDPGNGEDRYVVHAPFQSVRGS